jgi:hypothetical protein
LRLVLVLLPVLLQLLLLLLLLLRLLLFLLLLFLMPLLFLLLLLLLLHPLSGRCIIAVIALPRAHLHGHDTAWKSTRASLYMRH